MENIWKFWWDQHLSDKHDSSSWGIYTQVHGSRIHICYIWTKTFNMSNLIGHQGSFCVHHKSPSSKYKSISVKPTNFKVAPAEKLGDRFR